MMPTIDTGFQTRLPANGDQRQRRFSRPHIVA
jgi:hypothetical protein